MFGKGFDVGGDDGHVVQLVGGDVEEGGLVGGGLEDEEDVELTVPDGTVTGVIRYGAGESAARLWCRTRVQHLEVGG